MRWLRAGWLAGCLAMLPGVVPMHAAAAGDPACVAECERAESACTTATRRARADCARAAATGGRDPLAPGAPRAGAFCDFFQTDQCRYAPGAAACRQRMHARYLVCIDPYAKSGAAQYLECGAAERDALALCREELRACVASCG